MIWIGSVRSLTMMFIPYNPDTAVIGRISTVSSAASEVIGGIGDERPGLGAHSGPQRADAVVHLTALPGERPHRE